MRVDDVVFWAAVAVLVVYWVGRLVLHVSAVNAGLDTLIANGLNDIDADREVRGA